MNLILWVIVVASGIHVLEEYRNNWLGWARQFVPDMTMIQFLVVNALFLSLCVLAALVGARYPVFGLSVVGLILVNAVVHLVSAVRSKCYVPGLVSAVFLYLPLGTYAFYFAVHHEYLALSAATVAMLLGSFWMAVPVAFQLFRLSALRHRG